MRGNASRRPEPVSRVVDERRQQHILLVATGVMLALAASVLAYGWLTEVRLPLGEAVARVALTSGQPSEISVDDFQRRVRFERARYRELAAQDAEAASQLADVRGFGQMVLERMVAEVLVREEAARRGVLVSEDEVERYIQQAYGAIQAGPTPAEAAQAVPSSTRTAFEKKYRADLKVWARYGVNEQAFREIIRVLLMENKLRAELDKDALGTDAPAQPGDGAFWEWLDAQQARVTRFDRWMEYVPAEPAWP